VPYAELPAVTSLDGRWRAAVADDDTRRAAASDEYDDSGWAELAVPGHWRSSPELAGSDGPVIYRRRFTAARPPPGRRVWLTTHGAFYDTDVWLDGSYVTGSQGYFAPNQVEVTEALRERADHVLAIEVACTRPSNLAAKRNLTGVFQHWDCLDPRWNPGGLWRPVTLTETGPVRILWLRAVVLEADEERAIVECHAALDTDATHTVVITTTVDRSGPDTGDGSGAGAVPPGEAARLEQTQLLAQGENLIGWRIAVEDPELWWPRSLGGQPLYDLVVGVQLAGRDSDRTTRRLGLRQVEMDNFRCSVNGQRLFLKGACIGPPAPGLADATAEQVRAPVERAVEAGLDLLRLVGHIGHPDLYDAADEAGVLLWQDLPLQWGYHRGVRGEASRQATQAVDLLAHHPSLAVWCGHNEPFPIEAVPGHRPDARPEGRFHKGSLLGQQMPSFARTVTDASIKRALERADPSRPVIANSGVLPSPPRLDGTDSHLWVGWYHGDARDLPVLLARLPRLGRFVSEFGAHSVPVGLRWAGVWPPDLPTTVTLQQLGLPVAVADRYVPLAAYPSAAAWADATRRYQAELVRHHIETLRRLKYHPTGGFAVFLLQDVQRGIFPSLIDVDGHPKPAWDAVKEACRPVVVVPDRMPSPLTPGARVELAVHVVSDLRDALSEVEVSAVLRWPGGESRWAFGGDVGPDSVTRVGSVRFDAPASGPVELSLELTAASGHTAHHHHAARIT
jgi:beta-mannosidase